MTQTPIIPTSPDDIILDDDTLTQRLERDADAILAQSEDRAFEGVSSVRQAVREDAALLRDKVKGRVEGGREAIQDHPMKATLYALGAGVLIGLILSR